MKKAISLLLAVGMMVGLIGCGKKTATAPNTPAETQQPIDPNAIASVTLGEKTSYVQTVEELVAAIDPSGNTVVQFLKDISLETTIKLPYSCTVDFAGHTVTTNPKQGLGILVEAAGTENGLTKLQNGTVRSYSDCVRISGGSLDLSGMSLYCEYGMCVSLNNVAKEAENRITGCTLVAKKGNCFSLSLGDGDYTNTMMTLENSQMYALDPEGANVFHKTSSAVSGWVELGTGLQLYSYGKLLSSKNMFFNGSGLAKKTTTVTVDGTEYADITMWQEDTEDQVIDVLMIGNSFCYYFVQELHGIADAAGVQLNIGNLYYGACTVEKHWTWLQANDANYQQYWVTNDFGRYQNQNLLSMRKTLDYEDWDVVTMQQHYFGGSDDYETAMGKVQPYAQNLLDFLKTDQPNATIYWHNTWMFQVGHGSMPSRAEQIARQNRVNQVSQEVATAGQVEYIPSGEAWAIARSNPLVGDTLCKVDDKAHDGDTGGGQYLNACVWFEVITGKSCIGNTWRPTDYTLDETKAIEIQKAAHQAVAEIYGQDYAK